jgi:hypothetical protein
MATAATTWSAVNQEDAEQAWSAPVVPVGGRVGHVDHERFGNRTDDEVQVERETYEGGCLPHAAYCVLLQDGRQEGAYLGSVRTPTICR